MMTPKQKREKNAENKTKHCWEHMIVIWQQRRIIQEKWGKMNKNKKRNCCLSLRCLGGKNPQLVPSVCCFVYVWHMIRNELSLPLEHQLIKNRSVREKSEHIRKTKTKSKKQINFEWHTNGENDTNAALCKI